MTETIDPAGEAVDISTTLLIALHENKTDPVIAQAALGNAWYRLCKGIGYPINVFREMCDGMVEMYAQPRE